jgi:hypothetical protein
MLFPDIVMEPAMKNMLAIKPSKADSIVSKYWIFINDPNVLNKGRGAFCRVPVHAFLWANLIDLLEDFS